MAMRKRRPCMPSIPVGGTRLKVKASEGLNLSPKPSASEGSAWVTAKLCPVAHTSYSMHSKATHACTHLNASINLC